MTDHIGKGKKSHLSWGPSNARFLPSICSLYLASSISEGGRLAAKISNRKWKKLVRFLGLRGYRIKSVWRPYCLSALEGCSLGIRGLARGSLKPITWTNIFLSHWRYWREQLRFSKASANKWSSQSQLSHWGPILHTDFIFLKGTKGNPGWHLSRLTKLAQLAPLA